MHIIYVLQSVMHNRICRIIKAIINIVVAAKEKIAIVLFIMHLICTKVIPFNRIIRLNAATTNGLIPLDNSDCLHTYDTRALSQDKTFI